MSLLTRSEEVDLLKSSCAINGCTLSEAGKLLKSPSKADQSKLDAIAKTLSQLSAMKMAKKMDLRSDKESKTVLKSLSGRLTPFETYIAQTKNPDMMNNSAWVKKVFQKGAADSYEKVALLSNSCISFARAMDPFDVKRSHAICEPSLVRSAAIFCKRFGL